MSPFEEVLTAAAENLVKVFYRLSTVAEDDQEEAMRAVARKLGLHPVQLTCALGFNPSMRELPDILSVLGFDSYDMLARQRNEFFFSDIYRRLSIENILAIYARVIRDPELLQVMQY